MKKILSFSMLLLAFAFLFVSCSRDDEDNSSSSNYIQVDGGTKYDISMAGVQGYKAQNSSETSNYAISLVSINGSSAKTVMLALEFPYNQPIDGTYNITTPTRLLDETGTSYTEVNGSAQQVYSDVTVGTCTVKRNSTDNFTITFSFKPSNGKVISGQYSGTATVLEL